MIATDVITWIAAVLSVYRISLLTSREDGPFDIFTRLRDRVGQRNWIGRGLNCLYCTSFWFSFVISFVIPFETWYRYLVNSLAIGAAVILIDKMTSHR